MPFSSTPRPRRAVRRRPRWAWLAGATALLAPLGLLAQSPVAAGATATVDLMSDLGQPRLVTTTAEREVGTRFSSSVSGTVSGVAFYKGAAAKPGDHRVILWNAGGKILAKASFKANTTAGWQRVTFASPVAIAAGAGYVASYYSPAGNYAETPGGLSAPVRQGPLTTAGSAYRDGRGFPKTASTSNFWVQPLFSYETSGSTPQPTATATAKPTASPTATPTATATPRPTVSATATPTASPTATPTATATPTPTPTSSPTSSPTTAPTGWPSVDNTGVAAGQTLTAYTGSLTITANNTVISNRLITGTLNIRASNVQIVNTRINGSIRLDSPKTNNYSFSITDSEVHYPGLTGTGIMRGNFTAKRIEVTGGNRSVYCEYNCVIEDSIVHKQGADVGGDAHFSGIRMEQNGTFRHNTLICEAGRGPGTGCSAALTGYGDFAPVQNNLIENNRFIGNLGGGATMCAYGGSSGDNGSKPYGHLARDIRFINNVFTRGSSGKCGNLGAVAGFDPTRPGNVWQGNTWDDGSTIRHTD